MRTLVSTRLAVLILGLWLLMSAGPAARCAAAEWQWSVPDGSARAYLWIPPNCQRVRGVVVANHNMIEQGILEHPTLRTMLTDLGIAEVWVVPYLDAVFDFNKGAGDHFNKVIKALAEESGYGELEFAPVVPLGHSACATYPWNFAAWDPGRTLAAVSVHDDAPQTNLTGYGGPNINWGGHDIDGVPGLLVIGEFEWFEGRITPAFDCLARYPAAPVAMLCDAGHGHFDYSDELVSFLALFIRKAAEQRLPADAPLDKPVELKPIDPKKGWRIDRWRANQPPTAPAALYGNYTGDVRHAFWCFDEEMAQATEKLYANARGKKPQLLGFVQEGQVLPQSKTHAQVHPRFLPMEDGVSFRLTATFLDAVPGGNNNPAMWAGLPAGSPLGHAAGGGPIVISTIVGPVSRTGPDRFAVRLDRSVYTSRMSPP